MISVISSIYSPSRVPYLIKVAKQLKEKAGVEIQHIIVADGNEKTYSLIQKSGIGDTILLLPRNLELVGAINIAEKFAKFKYEIYMDEDVEVVTDDIFKKAIEIFDGYFPNGMGVLGFADGEQNCSRWLSTRKYAYQTNMGHFVWPEYFHGADREIYLKSGKMGEYRWSPELVINETKINDSGRKRSLRCGVFDDGLKELRKSNRFPNIALKNIAGWGRISKSKLTNRLLKNLYNE